MKIRTVRACCASILAALALISCSATAPAVRNSGTPLPEAIYDREGYAKEALKARVEEPPAAQKLPAPDPDAPRITETPQQVRGPAASVKTGASGLPMALPALPPEPAKTAVASKTQTQNAKQPTTAAKPAQTSATSPKKTAAATPKSTAATGPTVSIDPVPAASTGAETTQPRMREIFARASDEVEIGLEGESCLFLGFTGSTDKNGMVFKSKEARGGKTYFKFKAISKGTYDLSFQRQDNAKGKISKEAVRINVVPDAEFQAAVDKQTSVPKTTGAAQTEKADIAHADSLFRLGKYDAAVAEYLKGYDEGDGFINDRVASIYAKAGSLDAAEKYYELNMVPDGPYYEQAVLGLVRIALARRDSASFLSYLKPFLAIRNLDIGDSLLQAAIFLRERGENGVGVALLNEYMKRYPRGLNWDQAYYLLAQFLESDSPYRDIARAKELYSVILQDIPESRYAGPSKDRIRYIDQHFYYVR